MAEHQPVFIPRRTTEGKPSASVTGTYFLKASFWKDAFACPVGSAPNTAAKHTTAAPCMCWLINTI